MRSKERVLRFLAREEPDRVPINYSANPEIDRRLKSHFNLKADDGLGLREVLGVDFCGVGVPYVGPEIHSQVPGRAVDIWGVRSRYVKHGSGGYWDFCDFPLRDADEETVLKWPMPSPDDFDYSQVEADCDRQEQYGVFAGGSGLGCVINRAGKLRGNGTSACRPCDRRPCR